MQVVGHQNQTPSLHIKNEEMYAITYLSESHPKSVCIFLKTMDEVEQTINDQEKFNYQPKWYHKYYHLLVPSSAGTGVAGGVGLTHCCGVAMPILMGLSAAVCVYTVINVSSKGISESGHFGPLTDISCFKLYFARALRLRDKINAIAEELKKLQPEPADFPPGKIQTSGEIQDLEKVQKAFQATLARYLDAFDILSKGKLGWSKPEVESV